MSYSSSMKQLVGSVLIVLFLLGCGAPESTPIAEAPTTARTLEPPTATPVPPTETPPPVSPTPMPPTNTPAPTDPPEPAPTEKSHSDLPIDSLAFSLPGMDQVVVTHLEYPSSNGSPLPMDVYTPPGAAESDALPVVIFVMGYPNEAPYLSGPLKEMTQYVSWGRLVAASGLVAITYQTEQPDDLEAVMTWIQENGHLHLMDPQRIGLWSCSANSPTAMAFAMNEDSEWLKFAVFYYGQMLTPDEEFLDGIIDMCERSGCYAAELQDVTQLRTDLPLLIVRAGRDSMRYVNDSTDHFLAVASDSNVDLTLFEFAEGLHGFDEEMRSDPRAAEIIEQTLEFMNARFAGIPTPVPTDTPVPTPDGWTQKADMEKGRWFLSASVLDGKLYAIGGAGGSTLLEVYDPASDTWQTKAPMQSKRVYVSTAALDGRIYAFGGNTSTLGLSQATMEIYDPATDTWTAGAEAPFSMDGSSASIVDGKIYVIGGYLEGKSLSTVQKYDPELDTWTVKAEMPSKRNLLSTAVVNGKIYAIGGIVRDGGAAVLTVEEYDPQTDTWTERANLLKRRFGAPAVVLNDKIYLFGGGKEAGETAVSTVFEYNPSTDKWTSMAPMPHDWLGGSGGVIDDKIYLFGGTSLPFPHLPYLSATWEYEPDLSE